MKNLISAARVVRIYPPNNPVYSQSVKKLFQNLSRVLETDPEYVIGVQKSHFTCRQIPFGKDAQLNRSLAQELFGKGVREMIFSQGITEAELRELLHALALSAEEAAMKSGISTVLWENGVANVKVMEAGLDDVITASPQDAVSPVDEKGSAGKTLVLSDVKNDPEGFGAGMVAYAMRTRGKEENLEDRLFTLYQQAGMKILKDHANESDALFEGLAKSMLALDPSARTSLIAGRLYAAFDAGIAVVQNALFEQLPTFPQEIQTGRFSDTWSVEQVAVLLKRTVSRKMAPAPPGIPAADIAVTPVSPDLIRTVRSLEEEDREQVKELKVFAAVGMESDIIEAATRTLIFLIPLVKNPSAAAVSKKEIRLFSGVVQQLEDILAYLLKKNNYQLATVITEALHMQVEPEFRPRMLEARRKTVTTSIIKDTIAEMRKHAPGSPEYRSAFAYLAVLDRKAVEALLELIADESDREARLFLLKLLKNFGKNQTALLGERLSDDRWYVVRNVVSILAESKTDHAIAMLRKAADHKNVKIRREVLKGLVAYGGRRAVGLLARFLKDEDAALRLAAAEGFAELKELMPDDAKPLIEHLRERRFKKKDQVLNLTLIRTLGKVGGAEAGEHLTTYSRIRWWRSRKRQRELRDAAMRSLGEIMRREDGRPAQR